MVNGDTGKPPAQHHQHRFRLRGRRIHSADAGRIRHLRLFGVGLHLRFLEPSHVLRAMGVPFTAAHGSIRFSLSIYNTEEDIDLVIEKLPPIIANASGNCPRSAERPPPDRASFCPWARLPVGPPQVLNGRALPVFYCGLEHSFSPFPRHPSEQLSGYRSVSGIICSFCVKDLGRTRTRFGYNRFDTDTDVTPTPIKRNGAASAIDHPSIHSRQATRERNDSVLIRTFFIYNPCRLFYRHCQKSILIRSHLGVGIAIGIGIEPVFRFIDLDTLSSNKLNIQTTFCIICFIVRFKKEASSILKDIRFKNHQSRDLNSFYFYKIFFIIVVRLLGD